MHASCFLHMVYANEEK